MFAVESKDAAEKMVRKAVQELSAGGAAFPKRCWTMEVAARAAVSALRILGPRETVVNPLSLA